MSFKNDHRIINARDFGATGDSVTDDTTALQTAITTAIATGGTVYVPAGTYKITAALDFSALKGTNKSVMFEGAGDGIALGTVNGTTRIWNYSGGAAIKAYGTLVDGAIANLRLRGFIVENKASIGSAWTIDLDYCAAGGCMEDVYAWAGGFGGNGIRYLNPANGQFRFNNVVARNFNDKNTGGVGFRISVEVTAGVTTAPNSGNCDLGTVAVADCYHAFEFNGANLLNSMTGAVLKAVNVSHVIGSVGFTFNGNIASFALDSMHAEGFTTGYDFVSARFMHAPSTFASYPLFLNLTTGSVNAGSTALTVADSSGFVVGDIIRIAGASATAGDLWTTIAAIAGTAITLATPSARTVASVAVCKGGPGVTGSITSGTSALTVSDSTGMAIGNNIIVRGAGTAGADLATTITNVVGTAITLNTTASTSVTANYVSISAGLRLRGAGWGNEFPSFKAGAHEYGVSIEGSQQSNEIHLTDSSGSRIGTALIIDTSTRKTTITRRIEEGGTVPILNFTGHDVTVGGKLYIGGIAGTAPVFVSGSGSPESVITAPVGSVYMRTDGGHQTALYYKDTGTGNTGWRVIGKSRADVLSTGLGYITETFPRGLFSTSLTMVSGRIYYNAIGLLEGDVISGLAVELTAAAAALTLAKVALTNKTGTVLAISTDQSAGWTGAAHKDISVITPYTVPSDDVYYLSVLTVFASTAPTIAMQSGGSSINSNITNGGARPLAELSGQTDLVNGTPTVLATGRTPVWMACY
jgi:hypothetical protein